MPCRPPLYRAPPSPWSLPGEDEDREGPGSSAPCRAWMRTGGAWPDGGKDCDRPSVIPPSSESGVKNPWLSGVRRLRPLTIAPRVIPVCRGGGIRGCVVWLAPPLPPVPVLPQRGTIRTTRQPVERCWCGVSGLVLVDEQAWEEWRREWHKPPS